MERKEKEEERKTKSEKREKKGKRKKIKDKWAKKEVKKIVKNFAIDTHLKFTKRNSTQNCFGGKEIKL